MKSKITYYLILFVYISLLSCQMVVCHLTHSLIVLTDSYINIYKILDISVGLIHLKTQRHLANEKTRSSKKKDNQESNSPSSKSQALAGKLFNCACTYDFRRLPLLGGFVNSLFLAALLMSAAIEGIQTCFHASHSMGNEEKSILNRNPLTYPMTLVGFAIIDSVMQYCSTKAHQLREQELCSDSLLELNKVTKQPVHNTSPDNRIQLQSSSSSSGSNIQELAANQLERSRQSDIGGASNDNLYIKEEGQVDRKNHLDLSEKMRRHSDFESIPLDCDNDKSRISLKSLTFTSNHDELPAHASEKGEKLINSISRDLELTPTRSAKTTTILDMVSNENSHTNERAGYVHNKWIDLRFYVSPLALIVCAAIIYNFNHVNELITEVSDAFLSVLVVFLMFFSSYPPMKKAGKVLLQTAPDGVDLDRLKCDLSNLSIIKLKRLKVWSLTLRTNRIATCELVLDSKLITTEQQLEQIIQQAKMIFLKQNIKCTTIEPSFQ